jgi:putative hydrolase of the HAD superfamily
MRFADLDAVTLDAFGTLVALRDPVPSLLASLETRGVARSADEVRSAFSDEVAYYRPHAVEGADDVSLLDLRRRCTKVFLDSLGAALDAAEFATDFVAAIEFEPEPGVVETLERLRARGLELAVVSNWDCALGSHLERIGLMRYVTAVVTSAAVGAAKPDPAVFAAAVARLGVEPGRTLHVGDSPEDEEGARAAGLRFAHAPLRTAFEGWS